MCNGALMMDWCSNNWRPIATSKEWLHSIQEA
jgi:hypothetical protein